MLRLARTASQMGNDFMFKLNIAVECPEDRDRKKLTPKFSFSIR